jgi:hypothetical protein
MGALRRPRIANADAPPHELSLTPFYKQLPAFQRSRPLLVFCVTSTVRGAALRRILCVAHFEP